MPRVARQRGPSLDLAKLRPPLPVIMQGDIGRQRRSLSREQLRQWAEDFETEAEAVERSVDRSGLRAH